MLNKFLEDLNEREDFQTFMEQEQMSLVRIQRNPNLLKKQLVPDTYVATYILTHVGQDICDLI